MIFGPTADVQAARLGLLDRLVTRGPRGGLGGNRPHSLPYAYTLIASLVDELRDGVESVRRQSHAAALREGARPTGALSSHAIRGSLEGHFDVTLAVRNCHRIAVFRPEAVGGKAHPVHLQGREAAAAKDAGTTGRKADLTDAAAVGGDARGQTRVARSPGWGESGESSMRYRPARPGYPVRLQPAPW
ncbi:hypothetical protein [Streptomyces sp. NPDC005407]|uniref:hypothetical protein n=1 Tax=Streptomyces sp. NPDC005407 TaxID=3155340 RepID=UPI0033BD7DB3